MTMRHERNEVKLGGERGIRTLGDLRHTCFRDKPVQPLLHLSRTFIVAEVETKKDFTKKSFHNFGTA